MTQEEILTWITNGEHSGMEFKRGEEQMRLFQEGGFLHVETLPVSGTNFAHLDLRRVQDYFGRIRKLIPLPRTDAEWSQLLVNMEYLTTHKDQTLCTIAGLVVFGHK